VAIAAAWAPGRGPNVCRAEAIQIGVTGARDTAQVLPPRVRENATPSAPTRHLTASRAVRRSRHRSRGVEVERNRDHAACTGAALVPGRFHPVCASHVPPRATILNLARSVRENANRNTGEPKKEVIPCRSGARPELLGYESSSRPFIGCVDGMHPKRLLDPGYAARNKATKLVLPRMNGRPKTPRPRRKPL